MVNWTVDFKGICFCITTGMAKTMSTNCGCGTTTGMSATLSKSSCGSMRTPDASVDTCRRTTPDSRHRHRRLLHSSTHTIREPTLGLPGAALIMFVAPSVQGSGVRGGVGQLTRRWPTRDGQVLRATTPEGVSPIIGLVTLPQQTPWATRNGDPWPAPGFTSQSP